MTIVWSELFARKDSQGLVRGIDELQQPEDWVPFFFAFREALKQPQEPSFLAPLIEKLPQGKQSELYRHLFNDPELDKVNKEHLIQWALNHSISLESMAKVIILSSQMIEASALDPLLARLEARDLANFASLLAEKDDHIHVLRRKYLLSCLLGKLDWDDPYWKYNQTLARELVVQALTVDGAKKNQSLLDNILKHADLFDWQAKDFQDGCKALFVARMQAAKPAGAQELFKRLNQVLKLSSQEKTAWLEAVGLEKNGKPTRIMACVEAADDEDYCCTYATVMAAKNPVIRKACLKRMPLEQLCKFAPGFIAQPNKELLSDFIDEFASKVLANKEPVEGFLSDISACISCPLGEFDRTGFARQLNLKLAASLDKRFSWIAALLAQDKTREEGLSQAMQAIQENSSQTEKVRVFLAQLDSQHARQLYSRMIATDLPESCFHGYQALFANGDRRSQLFELLVTEPIIKDCLLTGVVNKPDDKTLLSIISQLLETAGRDKAYQDNLHKMLRIFCNRLAKATDEKEVIHQWSDDEYAGDWAYALLHSVDLVENLTPSLGKLSRSTQANVNLLLIDRVLNIRQLTDEGSDNLAVAWLNYFRFQAKDKQGLHRLVTRVKASAENRQNCHGQNNWQKLERSLWRFLGKDPAEFNEEAWLSALQNLKTEADFEAFLGVMVKDNLETHPVEAAVLMAGTKSINLSEIKNPAFLAQLLKHSLSPETQVNWTTVANWMKTRTVPQNRVLLKALMDIGLANASDRVLCGKIYELVFVDRLNEVLPLLDLEKAIWFLENSSPLSMTQSYANWLQMMSEEVVSASFPALLQFCPENQSVVDRLVSSSRKLQYPVEFMNLILELLKTPTPHQTWLVQALFKSLKLKALDWILDLFTVFFKKEDLPITAIEQLIALLCLKLEDKGSRSFLAANNFNDVKKIEDYLTQLSKVVSNPKSSSCLDRSFLLMQRLGDLDCNWISKLRDHQGLAAMIKLRLSQLERPQCYEDKDFWQHSDLARLILEHKELASSKHLAEDDVLQEFLYHLLLNQSLMLEANSFGVLFDHLKLNYRQQFVSNLLNSAFLTSNQRQILALIGRQLPIADLAANLPTSTYPDRLLPMILGHFDFCQLDKTVTGQFIGKIRDLEHLLDLLDCQTPLKQRQALVSAFFDYYGSAEPGQPSLSDFFARSCVTGERLAKLANFIMSQQDQERFEILIDGQSNYRSSMESYLNQMTTRSGFEIDQQSCLPDMIRQYLIKSNGKVGINKKLLDFLNLEELFSLLQTYFERQLEMDRFTQLTAAWSPENQMVCRQLLTATRWQDRLPLMVAGLIPIVNECRRSLPTRSAPGGTSEKSLSLVLGKTELYQQFIGPFLGGQLNEAVSYSLLDNLPAWLEACIPALESANKTMAADISTLLASQKQKEAFRSVFVDSQLSSLLSQDSYVGRADVSHVLADLGSGDVSAIVNAKQRQSDWLKHRQINLKGPFADLFQYYSQLNIETLPDEHIEWLFRVFLTNPVALSINNNDLNSLFSRLPIDALFRGLQQMLSSSRRRAEFNKALQAFKACKDWPGFLLEAYKQKEILDQLKAIAKELNLPALAEAFALAQMLEPSGYQAEQVKALFLPEAIRLRSFEALTQVMVQAEHRGIAMSQIGQYVKLGLCFHNDGQDLERLQGLAQSRDLLCNLPLQALKDCLMSYEPVINGNDSDLRCAFLQVLLTVLRAREKDWKNLLEALYGPIALGLVAVALEDPIANQSLLEYLLQSSSYAEGCRNEIDKAWNQLRKVGDHFLAPQAATLYTLQRILAKKPEQFAGAVALVRLQHYGASLDKLPLTDQQSEPARRQFYADVQTDYQFLRKMGRGEDKELEQANLWLRQQAQQHSREYSEIYAQMLNGTAQKDPDFYAGAIIWLAEMGKDPNALVSHFITWLANCTELLEQQKEVLGFMNQRGLLLLLINLIRTNKSALSSNQRQGLANYLVQGLKIDGKELAQLLSWGEWDWLDALEINDSARRSFILIYEALRNPAYVARVLADQAGRERFIYSLVRKHLSINDIKRLMNAISRSDHEQPGSPQGYPELAALDRAWQVSPEQKQQLISLLSLLILGNGAYLKSLEGTFEVKALAGRPLQPLRLMKLLTFLDLEQLSPTLIGQLKPEVLVNLLCSARHFSGWKQEQLQALFDSFKSVDEVLKYWLEQCLELPNAGLMFAAIYNVKPEVVQRVIASLGDYQRTRLLQIMLPCLDLNTSEVGSVFAEYANEEVLKQALRLYGQGHQNAGLIAAIPAMVDKINSQSLLLHPELGQLILPLYQNPAFESCQVKLNAGLRDYLRFQARTASLEPFRKIDGIDPGLLNVELSPDASVADPGIQVVADYPGEAMGELAIAESPLAAQLGSLTAFEYYLLHYNGDTAPIASLTRSWILSKAVSLDKDKRARLTRVASYMRPTESGGISTNAREALFLNFVQSPGLFNPEFCYSLMAYDAKRSIEHYSQAKKYPEIIALCDYALTALSDQDQPPAWKAMAEKARLEARTEQSIASISGWFSGLRRWWARARAYGFFSSKTPQYVLAYNQPAVSPTIVQVPNFVAPSTVGDLLSKAVDANDAGNIHAALKHYLHQPQSQYDWTLLEKVEQVYASWQTDRSRDTWLLNHKDVFIDNRQALLVHYLSLADYPKAKLCLSAWTDTAVFARIKEALYPEKEWPRVVARNAVPSDQPQSSVFGRILGAVRMGAAPSVVPHDTTSEREEVPTGQDGSWFRNLVSGLFNGGPVT